MNKTILKITNWNEPVIENFSSENAVNIAHVKYKESSWLNGTLTSTYVLHYTVYDYKSRMTHDLLSLATLGLMATLMGEKGHIVFVETSEYANGLVSNLTIKYDTAAGGLVNLKCNAQYTFENGQVVLLTDF